MSSVGRASSTLQQLRSSGEARDAEQKKTAERRRNLVVLMLQQLVDMGFTPAAAALQQEASNLVGKYEPADNMDLLTILQEFESYYDIKFGRKPRFIRKRSDADETTSLPRLTNSAGSTKRISHPSCPSPSSNGPRNGASTSEKRAAAGVGTAGTCGTDDSSSTPQLGPSSCMSIRGLSQRSRGEGETDELDDSLMQHRALRSLPSDLEREPELRALAATITREILQRSPGVLWDDIAGLDQAKALLKEAVVMPVQYPQLFKGLLSPWGGILLYGPPGTGKTMLARAVASQCRTTFFNISASSIVSKYRGDSEKLVRVLFDLARHHAPSTIFIDEVDSIMSQRGGVDGASEHEGSLRMKTELLVQMDGLAKSDSLIFVLAASNLPWNLDVALLRRLEKRVMVPLPTQEARELMIRKLLVDNHATKDLELDAIAARTEGYSGADIRLVCKEAAMRPVRRLMARLDGMQHQGRLEGRAQDHNQRLFTTVRDADVKEAIESDPVTMQDLDAALASTQPSTSFLAEKYTKWERDFGAV